MSRRHKSKVFEQLTVVDAGAKGKGIAKAPDGRIIFLNQVVPGDVVDVSTFKKRKNYYEGSVIRFHTYSSKREEPVCSHFGICGGCKWQHMGYKHQLFYKQKEVVSNLERLGGFDLPEVMPITGSEKQYWYRNKMEFSFSDNRWITTDEMASGKEITDRNALGFHIPGKWDKILDIEKCYLQGDPSNAIRLAVRNIALTHQIPFFNTRLQTGLLRSLMIRTATTGQVMVVVQFKEEHEEKRCLLLDTLISDFPQLNSLQYVINTKQNDTIYDQDVICYYGKDYIVEEMEGLRFKINAKSFYQTNPEQAYTLYKITRDFAGLTGKELVYDLYTGTGTIAQFIAKKAKKVIGVEAVPEAIADAKENAGLNGITNVDFFVGDMKTVFNTEFTDLHGIPDVVITDPPRDGMHKDVVAQLLKLGAKRIVYVSCNSATQARDLALMKDHYKIMKVQPVDMFPQTHHVENVVLLEKI